MCQSITSNYLTCGHTSHTHDTCLTALRYQTYYNSLITTSSPSTSPCSSPPRSPPSACSTTSNYTSWHNSVCDLCNVLLDLEILPQLSTEDPLVWMNNVYRASLFMKVGNPEGKDSVVEENLSLVVRREQRGWKVRWGEKVPQRGGAMGFDRKKGKLVRGLGAMVPGDILRW